MKIGIIGTGYVGLVSSVCLSSIGHSVVSIDKQTSIIDSLNRGIATIYEENLETMLQEELQAKHIIFSSDFLTLKDSHIIFLAVGTPPLPNGHADLSQIFSAIDSLLPIISKDTLLAVRSTVPIGTVSKIKYYLETKGKPEQLLGFCPEFLREGVAIFDFLNPQCLVFACDQARGRELLQEVYQPIIDTMSDVEVVHCEQYETAELIKYTINSFLATKITFINQIAQLAQSSGANIGKVIQAIGADTRIGKQFLTPSPGFGGSCFPKDTIALVHCGIEYGVDLSVVKEVNHSNKRHKDYIASWILETLEQYIGVEKIRIAVWGLAFKAGTDDVRDSASITIIQSFFQHNIQVQAYDPQGNANFLNQVNNKNLELFDTPLDATDSTDALVILTEWKEFSKIDIQAVKKSMNRNNPHVFDTRGIVNLEEYQAVGFLTHKFGI